MQKNRIGANAGNVVMLVALVILIYAAGIYAYQSSSSNYEAIIEIPSAGSNPSSSNYQNSLTMESIAGQSTSSSYTNSNNSNICLTNSSSMLVM